MLTQCLSKGETIKSFTLRLRIKNYFLLFINIKGHILAAYHTPCFVYFTHIKKKCIGERERERELSIFVKY